MKPDYDDPVIEEQWCERQRVRIADYLQSENVVHGRIGDWPAWHIAPYVAIWAIESVRQPDWIGWWAISGDLPTDYISATDVESPQRPRKALRAIAERWLRQVAAWKEGRCLDGMRIAGAHSYAELAPLLEARAALCKEWTEDDSLWDDE